MQATGAGAEIIALRALGWLAGTSNALEMFLQESGIEPADLRAGVGGRETARAVLEFLLKNEAFLIDFCEGEDIPARDILRACHLLDGE